MSVEIAYLTGRADLEDDVSGGIRGGGEVFPALDGGGEEGHDGVGYVFIESSR